MSNKLIFQKLLNIQSAGNQTLATSGNVNGIISDNSNMNITNSNINSINALTLNKQNDVSINDSNISGTIIHNLNNNITNTSKYETQHIVSNIGVNSLYNFPAVNFEKNRNNTDLELNTTLFNQPPYLSKPVLLSGDTPVFGSFNDGILLDDIQISIKNPETGVNIGITNLNGHSVSNTKYINVNMDIFFEKLPKNLNGHSITFIFYDTPSTTCKISNLIGGHINLTFRRDNKAKFIFYNCKNIKISALKPNNVLQCQSFGLHFDTCKNVKIQNIIFNNIQGKPSWVTTNSEAMLYFKDTNAVIKQCKIIGQNNIYGIIASNSKIYLEDTDFVGCIKNSILYNFASVDTNKPIETLQDYISEITSGELTDSTNIDGLYKHFHPGYLPPAAPTPVGATVGFPRIVNGYVYCTNLSASPNTDRGILYTRSMENTLPSCFIPFDLIDSTLSASWKIEYKEKLDWLSSTTYKDLVSYIVPFNTAVENNSYNLFFGAESKMFNDNNTSTSDLTNLIKQYTTSVQFIKNIKLSLTQNTSCRVNKAPNNNGIVSQTYSNSVNSNNKTYIFSAELNLLSVKQFFVASSYFESHDSDERLKDFYNNFVLKQSYIAFMIDNTYIKIPFKDIVRSNTVVGNTLYNMACSNVSRILSNYTTATTYDFTNIPIRFNKSITNIEVYYFGIPSDTNCCNIVGGGGKNDNFSTIKSFTYNNDKIFKLHTTNYSDDGCNINCNLILPCSRAYYQFYADTILCFYNNLLSNQTDLADNSGLLSNTHINLFMNRIFRRVIDAHNSSINYKYLSGITSSDFTGLYYQKGNDNKWWLINKQEIRQSEYKDYYITNNALYNQQGKIGTFINNDITINKKSYTLYDGAKNNLQKLSDIMPSAVLDIADEYETPPCAYIQTDYLNGKTYGNVPAEGYNFDFSRQSINSMVSGYFRLKEKGKKYIYTTQSTNRILTGQIDGFETNLNRLYNSLISLKTYISTPLYTYSVNNTQYNIYPFDTQSVLSTTPYALNQNLLKSNVLMATLNRITDVATSKHSKIITDNINNTKNDILFQKMYPQSFCQSISARYDKNAALSANILDSYQMYWPLSGGKPLSAYHTCIPIIKDDYVSNQIFKIGNSNISAYPFGWVGSNADRTTWYPYLDKRTLKCKHYYNKLPMVYNINSINTSTATITYTGYVKIEANSDIDKIVINSETIIDKTDFQDITEFKAALKANFQDITKFKATLKNARNVIEIYYNTSEIAVFVIPKNSTIAAVVLNTSDNLSTSKYQYFYSYTDTINCDNFSNFKNAYQNVISYMSSKVSTIYDKILSKCRNQASFMSYSVLYNNDTFIYGIQNSSATTETINFNELKSIPSYDEVFSIGSIVKYFNTTNLYTSSNSLYTSNYALSAIIPSLK